MKLSEKCLLEIKRIGLVLISFGVMACEKTAPQIRNVPLVDNASLAAAQLVLAEGHLADEELLKAIPYLLASSSHRERLEEVLLGATFQIPCHELLHPAPILHFHQSAGSRLYIALGGDEPTVIRWDLGQAPQVTAVMFPAKAQRISHLAVCKNEKFLIVHRDEVNLLCHAETLKPIAALPEFAKSLHPDLCQVFSENSLLIATASEGEHDKHLWHICDSATGEIIRSEQIPSFPKVRRAHFIESSLCLILENDTELQIPLHGEVKIFPISHVKVSAFVPSRLVTQPTPSSLILHQSLRLTSKEIETISPERITAHCGYELDHKTQNLREVPRPSTLPSSSAGEAVTERLALAYPQKYPEQKATELAQAEIIYQTFLKKDPAAIHSAIATAPHGLPAATALFLVIESKNPDFIQSALTKNPKLPPALLALARGKTPLPEIEFLQRTQDWVGYEAPDFSPLFLEAKKQANMALAALEITEKSSDQEIQKLVENLYDPLTLQTLGPALLAEKAVTFAQLLSEKSAHAETAIGLSQLAQHHGAHLSACLRARAAALTALSKYEEAHEIWIDLISHQAEASHLSSDYSEAAHTAFETQNPSQAIEILKTGLFRFPRDTIFAIRAAWIAMISGYTEEARGFLQHATQLGLGPEDIENTTALLLIVHHQLGDMESALSYLAQLQAISPKWSDPKAIKALAWPADFQKSLRETIQQSAAEKSKR